MPRLGGTAAAGAMLAAVLASAGGATADELAVVQVTLQGHRFVPAEVHVAAARPMFVEITNQDATPEEFESGILGVEKVVPGGGRVRLRLRPLAPGRFPFYGEYHQDTAQGAIIADAPAAK
jgi:hypothetical protein